MTDRDRALLAPAVLLPFVLVTLIWGSTWVVITGQLGIVPPAWSIAYRFAIGAATMVVVAVAMRSPLRIGADGQWLAIVFGILQFCVNFNCVYFAERHVTSGLVAVVYALLLVPNALLARLILRHPLGGRFILGAVVAIAGIILLFLQEARAQDAAHGIFAGIWLAAGGVMAASVANVIQASERLRTRSVAGVIAWGMAYGATANFVIAWIAYGPPVFDTRPVYIAGLLYLGIIASAVAFPLYLLVLRAAGPARAAYSGMLVPIIAMVFSTLFEGYRWTTLSIAGSVLALAGLFIAIRARRTPVASG